MDESVLTEIQLFKSNNSKIFYKLLEGLEKIGNFDTHVEFYFHSKSEEKDDNQWFKIWSYDKEDNIFIINVSSNNRTDLFRIIKENADGTINNYNLSLSKKFPLDSANIEFTKCSKEYNFKDGRLIIDGLENYNLFLGSELVIAVNIKKLEKPISIEYLLSQLNSSNEQISLYGYLKILDNFFQTNQTNFGDITVTVLKNFSIIQSFVVSQQEEKNYSKVLKK